MCRSIAQEARGDRNEAPEVRGNQRAHDVTMACGSAIEGRPVTHAAWVGCLPPEKPPGKVRLTQISMLQERSQPAVQCCPAPRLQTEAFIRASGKGHDRRSGKASGGAARRDDDRSRAMTSPPAFRSSMPFERPLCSEGAACAPRFRHPQPEPGARRTPRRAWPRHRRRKAAVPSRRRAQAQPARSAEPRLRSPIAPGHSRRSACSPGCSRGLPAWLPWSRTGMPGRSAWARPS
jgi:hypothetical protein